MNMRAQLVQTVEGLLAADERLVLLLGDIGVYGFRRALERHPARVYNIGILEQATVGLAAGLAMTGLVPIVHTIAPFLVERCIEQLKDDFGYQKLGGNFVSVGASYDYASLGSTHHCPADVPLLANVPGFEIVVPGTPAEFDRLFRAGCTNGRPTYFRLSERRNPVDFPVAFGKAHVVRQGSAATVVAVGPALAPVLEAVEGLDAAVLYYTCIKPFDAETLKRHCSNGRILLCEPYYRGALVAEIQQSLAPRPLRIECVGVPHEFMEGYGRMEEHDARIGLTADGIRRQLLGLMEPLRERRRHALAGSR